MRPSEKFRSWLEKQIATRKRGARLPTAEQLAETWGVSQSTVTRILRTYQRDGALVRIPRRGTFIGPLDDADTGAVVPEPVSSTQSIVDEIKRSITNGSLRKGDALPSVKFMSRQFKVAPRTVIAAYRDLALQTHVVRVGKTYWVGTFSALTKHGQDREVFLFKTGAPDYTEVLSDDRFGLAYHKMEKELVDHGFVVHYDHVSSCHRLLEQWRTTNRWPSGVAFHRMQHDDLERLTDFVKATHRPHQSITVPVLVDIDTGDYHLLPRGAAMLSRGNVDTTFARTIVHYVTTTQTRRVRFFMHYDGHNVFDIYVPVKTRTELKSFAPDFDIAGVVTAVSPEHTRERFFDDLRATVPDNRKDAIVGKYHYTPFEQVEKELAFVGFDRPPFEHIDRGLWLFTSDVQAAEAARWACDNRIRVPEDLAIIALRNRPATVHTGVSVCTLDWNNAGYLMAHALLGDISYERTRKGFMRIGAQIVHRRTTKAE